jgi:hypothetical protein
VGRDADHGGLQGLHIRHDILPPGDPDERIRDQLAGSVVRNRSAPVDAKDRHRFVGQIVSQRARAGSVDGRNSV